MACLEYRFANISEFPEQMLTVNNDISKGRLFIREKQEILDYIHINVVFIYLHEI